MDFNVDKCQYLFINYNKYTKTFKMLLIGETGWGIWNSTSFSKSKSILK